MTFFYLNQASFPDSISSIEYIYVNIKYIKSKSNTQNYQVESNKKMIFTMEEFKSLVFILSKFHDYGKAASTNTTQSARDLELTSFVRSKLVRSSQ